MNSPFGSSVLDVACRLTVPFIILFAIYVVAHGHYSPGGGFQGGAILAATFILMRMVRRDPIPWGLDRVGSLILACSGLLLYLGIGLLSFLFSGHYLDYGVLPLPFEPGKVRALGSFGIEIGVTMGVTGVLVLIFDALTDGVIQEDDDV